LHAVTISNLTPRCIDHSIHCAAYHFLKALHIPSLSTTKHTLQEGQQDTGEVEELDDSDNPGDDPNDDVDICTNIEASPDDVAAMASTTVTDFEPGDMLGKLLAFVNQVCLSSEGVCDYLDHACAVHQIKAIKLRLWVWTRWGSMSNCLEATLAVQKVCLHYLRYTLCSLSLRQLIISVLLPILMKTCRLYKRRRSGLTISWWLPSGNLSDLFTIVSRFVLFTLFTSGSNIDKASCQTAQRAVKRRLTHVYPMLEMLMSDWEELLKDLEYELVHNALYAGIGLLEKYYRCADDTDAYFISHSKSFCSFPNLTY
jgi:hypothetical protein